MRNLIEFIHQAGKLKKVKRTGWGMQGVSEPETVAEHSYRVSILAMTLAKKFGLDELKLIKMALIHDLGETITGDIVTEKGNEIINSKKEKFQKEKEAMQKIFSNVERGEEYLGLWLEYEEQKTPEARILKQLDKIEMIIQALEYEETTDPNNLTEFWLNTKKYLKENNLIEIFNILKKRRKI